MELFKLAIREEHWSSDKSFRLDSPVPISIIPTMEFSLLPSLDNCLLRRRVGFLLQFTSWPQKRSPGCCPPLQLAHTYLWKASSDLLSAFGQKSYSSSSLREAETSQELTDSPAWLSERCFLEELTIRLMECKELFSFANDSEATIIYSNQEKS